MKCIIINFAEVVYESKAIKDTILKETVVSSRATAGSITIIWADTCSFRVFLRHHRVAEQVWLVLDEHIPFQGSPIAHVYLILLKKFEVGK